MASSTLAMQPPAPITGSTAVFSRVRRNSLMIMAGTVLALLYLLYTFISFDLWHLISRSQPQRAVLLATDAVAHKVHVTKTIRGAGGLSIAVEGERTATYETPPGWVTVSDDLTRVDLAQGYRVDIYDTHVIFQIPDMGPVHVRITDAGIETTLPRGVDPPDWLRATPAKFDARPTIGRRVQVSRARIEAHRYFMGWENFFFPFRSELTAYSPGQLFSLAFSDQRLDPDMPNWRLMAATFWNNPGWQHKQVFIALLETFLMAVLGTLTAALVGLHTAAAA